jgi:hypothetical protein
MVPLIAFICVMELVRQRKVFQLKNVRFSSCKFLICDFSQKILFYNSVWIRIRIQIRTFIWIRIQPKFSDFFGLEFGSTTLQYIMSPKTWVVDPEPYPDLHWIQIKLGTLVDPDPFWKSEPRSGSIGKKGRKFCTTDPGLSQSGSPTLPKANCAE